MSDKDKRSAFTTVVMSDIENNTQEVVYNSYTLPLLIYDGTDMSKNIEKIEAVPDKGITIQNDIIFYDNTYESAEDTFEFVMITMKELEGSQTHSLAELIEDGFTITPFINGDGGGGDSDFSTANVYITTNRTGGGTLLNYIRLNGLAYISGPEGMEGIMTNIPLNTVTDRLLNVVLYKGRAMVEATGIPEIEANVNITNISTTGNITTSSNVYIDIRGDGTITIDYTVS